jgi:hypothetical protein
MLNTHLPPMRPEAVVCPNSSCESSGRIGIHSAQERRYKCHGCGKTFSETKGTVLYGLKYPAWLVVCILTLLAYGCPVPAIVMAFGLDEAYHTLASIDTLQEDMVALRAALPRANAYADGLKGKSERKYWHWRAEKVASLLAWLENMARQEQQEQEALGMWEELLADIDLSGLDEAV